MATQFLAMHTALPLRCGLVALNYIQRGGKDAESEQVNFALAFSYLMSYDYLILVIFIAQSLIAEPVFFLEKALRNTDFPALNRTSHFKN